VTFGQGDFYYDGKVDAAHLGILARNWQKTVDGGTLSTTAIPMIPGLPINPAPTPVAAPRRTPTRVATLIL
jgi:hypothetical protein